MLPGWLAIVVFLACVGAFYATATHGDRAPAQAETPALRRAVYTLSACVYCSSWTFYGSIGFASRRGLDFLPLYLGPILVFAFLYPVLIRMIRLSKGQNITSIADFVSVRYGKSASVAAVVTIIAAVALIPFLAIQIKTVTASLSVFLDGRVAAPHQDESAVLSALVTLVVGALTIAIGTRRLDATEHHRGLMLAVAASSAVKLAAFAGVGAFVSWGVFKGIGDLTHRIASDSAVAAIIDEDPIPSMWLAVGLASAAAIFVLPRQFHVSIVENRNESDVRTAAWGVPLYIVAICVFVLPIAAAGLILLPGGGIDRDFTILALPIHQGAPLMTLLALVGGQAAALSALIVTAIVLAVMASNDLVMPTMLRIELRSPGHAARRISPILGIRRIAIVIILALAWLCSTRLAGSSLSSIGFLSMITMVQVAPATFGGLVWSRATARGAIGGCIAGTLVCAYTLMLPAFSAHSSPLIVEGPLGLDVLRPTDLFGISLPPLQQALLWSLSLNVIAYVVLSLTRPANTSERLQAGIFVRQKPTTIVDSFRMRPFSVTIGELLATVARYLGRTDAECLFADYLAAHNLPLAEDSEADGRLLKYAESLIASSIGAASSRTVVSLLLERREISHGAARDIVDDAAFEVENSRDVLQHAIDIAHDGMAIFDRDLRLVAWNRAYRDMFQLPSDMMRIGVPLDVLVQSNAERGVYGPGPVDEFVASRLETLTRPTEGNRIYHAPFGRVLEMRSVRLHNGGLFFTYSDATAQVKSEEEMEAENVTLERRVRERTEELETLNFELARAKAEAEDANISKTRFLAAASHDILQPLNAARLYTSSLRERLGRRADGDEVELLATHVDSSLEAVEDILGALLEISHLDAGATKTEITSFDVGGLLRQLEGDFEPIAQERGLRLRIVGSSLPVVSDRRLLRRLLQNLISNAIKYTPEGRVLVGARRAGDRVTIHVYDTGVGIPAKNQMQIFREFERLPQVSHTPGAGLGLSIVERLSRVLKHEIELHSAPGMGSRFSVGLGRGETMPAILGPQTPTRTAAQTRQRSLDGLKVAAIDNERDILVAMESLLRGWDCVVASGVDLDGIETALDAKAIAPDVIVADYHIGDMNGLDVIAALRARYGHRPAVLVTADRAADVRDRAADADVRVLNKPLKPAALRSLMSQWRLVKAAAE